MDPDKFAKLPVRIEGVHNVSLELKFLDAGYRLEYCERSSTTSSGHTAIFRLVPTDPPVAGFVSRWDNREQTIDVDPEPPNCIDRDDWRDERNGYRGHHSRKVNDNPRIYEINLHTPAGPVLHATIRLNIDVGMQFGDTF
jgi:hypothetical protein